MDLVALGAFLAGPLVFLDAKGELFDLDLLQNAYGLVGSTSSPPQQGQPV